MKSLTIDNVKSQLPQILRDMVDSEEHYQTMLIRAYELLGEDEYRRIFNETMEELKSDC